MILTVPNSFGVLREVNHCHGHAPGHPCADEAPVTYLPDTEFPVRHKDSAAFYSRPEHRIYAREKYQHNEALLAHEQGHALLGLIQPPEWQQVLDGDADAKREFLATTTARSYIGYRGANGEDLRSFDWVEASADLYMEYRLGRLVDKPALSRTIETLLHDAAARRKAGQR